MEPLFVLKPVSAYDYFGAVSEATGIAVVIMGVYNAILWRYNPLEKAPRLGGHYSGHIQFNFSGKLEKKEVDVFIRQTVLTVTETIAFVPHFAYDAAGSITTVEGLL